ncbi:MAG: PRC-barrel domain-containing protein [Anaerolineales bacterium]|nr:PRC-barrel domain-containing protein [Anaerolineales bacterium]
MLRSATDLQGYTVRGVDGDVGEVTDLYFDDKAWIVRYLVVRTGGWLSGREVLLTPLVCEQPDWDNAVFPVSLTKEQIENSPEANLHKPVSRQQEVALHQYYGWAPYWTMAVPSAPPRPMPITMTPPVNPVPAPPAPDMVTAEAEDTAVDPHLRSLDEVTGYHIAAEDGDIGHVETFVVDDASWSIMYMVVDTRNWLPGRKVLVALQWVQQIAWIDRRVYVDLHQETIKNSPEYDPDEPLERAYEERLYDYYGRPRYW